MFLFDEQLLRACHAGRLQVYDTGATGRLRWNPVAKNYVDNQSNSPQYLGVASLSLLQLGSETEVGNPFKGKIVHGGNFMPAKKKAAKKKKH
jgi:hypothetical protein